MRFRYLILAASLAGCVAGDPHRPAPVPTAIQADPDPRGELSKSPLSRVAATAPRADRRVLALALQARSGAIQDGLAKADSRLAVIDYSQPSTGRRLWVFDVDHPRLLFDDYVAHGKGSGENLAREFSNEDGSLQSSIGLFRAGEASAAMVIPCAWMDWSPGSTTTRGHACWSCMAPGTWIRCRR